MIVRFAKLKDVNKIAELLSSSPEIRTSEEIEYSKPYIKLYVKSHLKNSKHIMLVCVENEEIVGVLTSEIWIDKKYAFISNIVVDKSNRGGCGKILYNNFEKICIKKHLKNINFLVQTRNKKMQRWSKKQGFKKGHSFYFYEKEIKK